VQAGFVKQGAEAERLSQAECYPSGARRGPENAPDEGFRMNKAITSRLKVLMGLYTEAPLSANTTYRVTVDGTTAAGSVHFDWSFTTGAAPTKPGGGRRG